MRIVDTPYGRGQVKGRNIVTAGGVKTVRLLVNILRKDWRADVMAWPYGDDTSISGWLDEGDTTPATRDNVIK